jgi:nucleotide-binding universal stress UspA family protein
MYTNILIPTDGSELSNKAIRHGIALAKACNAKVTGSETVKVLTHSKIPVLVYR